MCRINGIINSYSNNLQSNTIVMRDAMKHGGPDNGGIYYDESISLGLGHRRLSIIDLTEAGNQPMQSINGLLTLIFNGEIYRI